MIEEEDDEISDEELACSYIVLCQNWVNSVKINKDLQGQIHQLNQDNGALEKEVATLKEEILKNNMAQYEIEHLRKLLRMMDSRMSSLDQILCMGTTSNAWEGIGYQRGSLGSKLVAQNEIPCPKTVKVEEIVQTFP